MVYYCKMLNSALLIIIWRNRKQMYQIARYMYVKYAEKTQIFSLLLFKVK